MSEVFEFLFRILHIFMFWRVLLATTATIVLIGILVRYVPWVNGFQCMAFFFIGFFLGHVWNEWAWLPKKQREAEKAEPPRETKWATALAGSGIFGLIWGGISRSDIGSSVFGALVLLAIVVLLYFRRSTVHRQAISNEYAFSCIGVAAIAFLVPIIAFHFN